MEVANMTGRTAEYRIKALGSTRIATSGTPEARREEARAEQDVRAGRYDTFKSSQELVQHLQNLKGTGASVRRETTRTSFSGRLAPKTLARLSNPSITAFKVDFFVDGKLIASKTVREEPFQVVLLEQEGKYRIYVAKSQGEDVGRVVA